MFPTIEVVASELTHLLQWIDSGEDGIDVRLQVGDEGYWHLHFGDASFDTDHTGHWGCGWLTRDSDLADLAKDLIAEAQDSAAQCGEDDSDSEPSEPDEDDYTTSDHKRFYSSGRLAIEIGEDDDVSEALRQHFDAIGFFPSVWFVSDHGNAHLIDLDS